MTNLPPNTAGTSLSRPRFFAMCCGEPFRLFFPLGLVSGIVGLALWPLHLWGVLAIIRA